MDDNYIIIECPHCKDYILVFKKNLIVKFLDMELQRYNETNKSSFKKR